MKLLIEEYQYDVADVENVLDGLFTLQDVDRKVSVNYVGYYYNPNEKVRDVVFILPKVLLGEPNERDADDRGYVFGKYKPKDLIHLDEANIEERERKFIYEFAVWIHRAIVVYNDTHAKNGIVLHRQIENEGKGLHKKKCNTLLDVILSLLRFNKENQQFFTFILKNIHSGFNKINWGKTIARTTAIVQGNSPVYLNPVNKKRQVNFDEELIIIFFSILQYISETFGFRSNINFGFNLITGAKFRRYLDGFGRTRLRQIKYKYFSDTAVGLWNLCYAFFDKAYKIRVNTSRSEYMLVKSFHIVFEAMIDELIGIPHEQLPTGLADQYDGKIVDHFYTYDGLLVNDKDDDGVYYIGDSKYYKIGNSLGTESIYKQRTYARNVIQWNLDIWLNGKANKDNQFERIQLFDEVTEGYNIIPNFFISAAVDWDTLSYTDDGLKPHSQEPDISRQFKNRLYDRDTLLLSHYDVNFLFVLSLYARNRAAAKSVWRESVRAKFRKEIQRMLEKKFDFYALAAHPDVDASEYFKTHFRDTLGKTFCPYKDKTIFSLALDKSYTQDNDNLLKVLKENFYVVPVELGEDLIKKLEEERENKGVVNSPQGIGKFLFCVVDKYANPKEKKKLTTEYELFHKHSATSLIMRKMPEGDITKVKFLAPMLDGGISGYYAIEGISFGLCSTEKADKKDVNFQAQMPCLNITLGKYTSLGDYSAEVPNYSNRDGQIHTFEEVMNLYKQNDRE